MPVHLREDVVQESEHQGCLSSPVQLCRGHAVRAHSIDPPPVLDAGHLVFPVFLEHFYGCVRLGDIRLEDDEGFPLCRRLPRQGFPPAPPVPAGVGGNGALLSGPSTPPRRRSPSSACPYQGPRHPGAGWCCGGPSQGPISARGWGSE